MASRSATINRGSSHHYWLVATNAGTSTGGFVPSTAKIVDSGQRPVGYNFIVDLGTSEQSVLAKLPGAEASAPTGVSIPPDYGNIPGLGKAKTGSPAGITTNDVGTFRDVANAVTSTLDFLKLISWIFYPQNLLRAVEFVVGIILMIFGLHAAMQARGERVEGFSTSEGALTRSGLGRVATELGRAARAPSGSRQVQRPRSAPHKTRQKALAQRYKREEDLQRRRAKAPRPKKKP